jgi:OOP family OmpA-OmpF porin
MEGMMRVRTLLLFGMLTAATSLGLASRAEAQSAPAFQIEQNQLKVPGPVVFDAASERIKPESDAVLSHVKAFLEAKSYITLLRIEGHTDNSGDPVKNQQLSEKRAVSVARWLIIRGIDCKRLLAVGFGGEKPVADSSTADGKAQNRRTVFAIAQLRGHAIGGLPVDGGGRVATTNLCQ